MRKPDAACVHPDLPCHSCTYARKQAPVRLLRSVEIFASSWNMGGVDRESCLAAMSEGDLETGAGRSALQAVIPLWIPKGYDLYVSPPARPPASQSTRKPAWHDFSITPLVPLSSLLSPHE